MKKSERIQTHAHNPPPISGYVSWFLKGQDTLLTSVIMLRHHPLLCFVFWIQHCYCFATQTEFEPNKKKKMWMSERENKQSSNMNTQLQSTL